MGVMPSKSIHFYDSSSLMGNNNCDSDVHKQQVVHVNVNGEEFKSTRCVAIANEIQFHINSQKYFKILYDDIVSVSFSASDVSGDESDHCADLFLLVYWIDDEGRTANKINISFKDGNVAKEWHQMIHDAISAPLPPHFALNDAPRKRRKVLVIVNPFGGKKEAKKLWEKETEPIFISAQLDYDLILTEHVKHATEIAKTLRLDSYDGVAVVSGDGLVLEIIEGFLMRADRKRALKMPIAHIPAGTSNGLAASICFQCNEPFAPRGKFCLEAALMVARPRYLPLRICHVQTERDGDKAMFMSATWGLIADIDIGSERFRWAGMARLHLEAFIRIAQLPTVARYKARISYLPVNDERLKQATKLRHIVDRKMFGENHFKYDKIENITECSNDGKAVDNVGDALRDADFLDGHSISSINEPVPDDWVTIEGNFVFACAVNISHLGSDLPYMPSSRLDDPILFLTLCNWDAVSSRIQVGLMMITINGSHHLNYPCFETIPVYGCRIEPLEECGGYIAVDGEPITPGTAFQVLPSKYCATVMGRNERQ